MVVNVIMKRYFTGAIKYGLFFFFLLSSAHSFAQETGGEQVLQFECTAINIGTLSEDDAPVTYHFKYCIYLYWYKTAQIKSKIYLEIK